MENDFHNRIKSTCEKLIELFPSLSDKTQIPHAALILGSGFSPFSDGLKNVKHVSYERIPGFPLPTVEGHFGRVSAGLLQKKPIMVFGGRYHTYEAYSAFETTYPVLTAKALGIETIITSNAAGSLNSNMSPGDIMVLKDHIMLLPDNPLRGIGKLLSTKKNLINFNPNPFQDMTYTYDKELRLKAGDFSVESKEGVLAVVQGPSYETPAEVKMLATLGANAVCMSTAPEVIMARYLNMRTFGFSLITNFAAGVSKNKMSHQDVLKTGVDNIDKVSAFLHDLVDAL